MVSEITWSGSQNEVARKLELNFLYPLQGHYTPKIYPNIGEELFLYDDKDMELFGGRVFYNERLGEQGTTQVTAYDDAIRLAKSRGTYNFKGKTAEAITRTVCNDLGVEIGQLAPTGIPQKMFCNGEGMYEIISNAYEGASKQNKKIDLVGIFQDVYTKEQDKQAGTVASNMLRGIEQSMELTTLGNTSYASGKLVNIEDSATKQLVLFFIVSDSHSWRGGQYRTIMKIGFMGIDI